MKYAYFLLAAAVFLAGCVSNQPITELRIPGHGQQVYVFANDIRDTLNVPLNNPAGAKLAFDTADTIAIVFNGTSGEDNAFFRVILIDMAKIPVFYSYEGRALDFEYFYFTEGNGTVWFNENGTAIEEPKINATTLLLKGPHTGASADAVTVINNTIVVEGSTLDGLRKAGDRLTLAVFGINSAEDLERFAR